MRPFRAIEQPKQVIVEGNDEDRIFRALCNHMQLTDVQIQPIDGINNLRRFLDGFTGDTRFESVRSLAVFADADTNRDARSDLVRGALSDAGLPVPARPLQLASDGPLSVAYMIVPPEGSGTMIEDLCLDSVAGDPAMQCVETYLECLDEIGDAPPASSWTAKARAHAFLASRERPGLRLGEAADSGVWPLDQGAFDQLRSLLTML